jgi:Sugar kinases, ribokinase family
MKFITIGELLLRLSPPNYENIRTTNSFIVNYGGAEANVAVSLANLGIDSTVFTVLPNNDLGKSAIRYLKSNDVHTSPIIMGGDRIGTYYLEEGISVRASQVIYDRKYSAFAEYDYTDVNLEAILKNYDWLHLSGITPPLSPSCRVLLEKALVIAKRLNMVTSFDCNYRGKLWKWEEARDVLSTYMPYVDILIGIEPLHLYNQDGIDIKEGLSMTPSRDEMHDVFTELDRQFHFKCIARHVRHVHSVSNNSLMGYLYMDGTTYESQLMNFNILDRVGGGDAFSSGLIFALMEKMSPNDTINFAVASSVMKHSIRGDTNIADKDAILKLMDGSLDIQR